VPDEMEIFGDNGQGDSFGLWLPRDGGVRPVVVHGAVFEEACPAVVAEDLECVAEFEIPEELRSLDEDGSEEEFYSVLAWACPGLPDPKPDPYERGLTAEQVNEFARSDGR
jgi:hypothetical protein